MRPATKARPVMMCLLMIMRKYNKLYCYPSQKKLLYLLDRYQEEKKGIASLNRWLRVIEDEGYIERKRRIKRDRKHGMMFKSTLYQITYKGFLLLERGGVAIWDIMKKITGSLKKQSEKRSNDPESSVRGGGFVHVKDIVGALKKCPIIEEHGVSS